MIISAKQTRGNYPNLYLNNTQLLSVPFHTHLGLTLSDDLTWDKHIDRVCTSSQKSVNLLKRLYKQIPRETKIKHL
jgi:hypothetical protein